MRQYAREVRAAFQQRFSVIGGAAAFSNAVLAGAATIAFVGTFANHVWRLDEPVGVTLLRSVLSACLACAILGPFRLGLLHVRGWRGHPVIAFLAYATSSLIVVSVMNSVFDTGSTSARGLYESTILPAIIVTVALAVIAFVVGNRASTAELNAEIAQRHAHLIALREGYEVDLAHAREELARQVHENVESRLAEVHEAMAELRVDQRIGIDQAGQLLVHTVRDVVRPLSHQLMREPEPAVPSETAVLPTQNPDPRRRVLDVAVALQPGWATLAYAAFSFTSAQVSSGDALGSTARAAFAVLVLPLIVLVQRFWPNRWRMLPTTVAFMFLATSYVASLTIARYVYIVVQETVGPPLPPVSVSIMAFAFAATIIAITLALTGVVAARREATRAELEAVNTSIQIQIARLRQEIWLSRTSMSWYLHGPVQSALISASIALNSPGLDQGRIAEIRRTIDEAVRNLRTFELTPQSVEQALLENGDLWQDSCAITWTYATDAAQVIDASPALTKAIAEIVREAISNAVRHGSAAGVHVDISLASDALITVEVTDDGTGLPPVIKPGLGSALLDQVCLKWTRATENSGTHLVALLPR